MAQSVSALGIEHIDVKSQLMRAYRCWTKRSRQQLVTQLASAAELPTAVLFYHRVADTHPNAWTMSCRNFCKQLDWLQENFDIVSLGDAQRAIQSTEGNSGRMKIAITFDDGYADNAKFAIPELAKRGLTATYFVSTDFVVQQKPFPHDLVAGTPLAVDTIETLQSYLDCGMSLGAHTRSHINLGAIQDEARMQQEIEGGLRQLQNWFGDVIDYFAFPFGLPENTSQLAVDVIKQCRFKGFCTAYGAFNWSSNEGFHIRRIHADPGIEKLKNWLTLDRRKLVDRYQLPFQESPHRVPHLIEA